MLFHDIKPSMGFKIGLYQITPCVTIQCFCDALSPQDQGLQTLDVIIYLMTVMPT